MAKIAWGKKVSKDFKAKVISISDKLGCDPSHLMSAMAFETGESFSPTIQNAQSGATGLIQLEIKGLVEPKSAEAERICREDLTELVTAFVQDKQTIERGVFDNDSPPEELTQVRMGKIVKEKFPLLNDEDQEAVRQHAVAARGDHGRSAIKCRSRVIVSGPHHADRIGARRQRTRVRALAAQQCIVQVQPAAELLASTLLLMRAQALQVDLLGVAHSAAKHTHTFATQWNSFELVDQ